MTDLTLYTQFANSANKLTDLHDSVLSLYDAMMNDGSITDQSVMRELAQLRAKTDITLKDIN